MLVAGCTMLHKELHRVYDPHADNYNIRPEEVWRRLKLLSWRVIFCLPKMLLKGFWLNLKVKWGKK